MASSSTIYESLSELIPLIFDQAQNSAANHHKNYAALYRLHMRATTVRRHIKYGDAINVAGEKAFCDSVIEMIARILVIKKGPLAAERIVRFIGGYIKFLAEKDSSTSEEETPITRFVSRLLHWLLGGFTAKDKTVRFRSVQIVTEMITYLGELEEDTYTSLRRSLTERTCDREPTIRTLAVIALAKLVGSEDTIELAKEQQSIMSMLLQSLCYDTSADVRRLALLHTPLTPRTLPALLTRSRDVDPVVRKLLFSSVLTTVPGARKTKSDMDPGISTATKVHPRQLTLTQRERIVRDGLGDREITVLTAAIRMVNGWFDVIHESTAREDMVDTLVEFLKLFDLTGLESVDVAVDVLNAMLSTRPDIFDAIAFSDGYWSALVPETIFIARVFVTYCKERGEESRLESAGFPVATALAFYLQETCNELLDGIEDLEEARLLSESLDSPVDEIEDLERKEDVVVERGFIVAEMLRIALRCDYTDETGRRKLFAVVREMLAHELLPESLMEPCLDILKETTVNERELIRIVVEIVTGLRDTPDNDQLHPDASRSIDTTQSSLQSVSTRRTQDPLDMTPEQRARADAIDVRCLGLCIAMLSRVNGTLDENSTLEGILADLIIPAAKRKELVLRERGLVSLGLCCLISKDLALNSLQLFFNQVQSSPEQLKIKILHVVFDILLVYDEELLLRSNEIAEKIVTFILQTLETEDSTSVQAVLCVGITKLMLCDLVSDKRVLTSLVLAYVSPANEENQELRQCLAHFLPAYCYSSAANQAQMRSIAMTAYDLVVRVHAEMDDDEDMITPFMFGLLLVDWTDTQKLINVDKDIKGPAARDNHLDLAIDILRAVYDADRREDDRKTLCQLLGQLQFSDHSDEVSLLVINILVEDLQTQGPIEDAASEKMIDRFESRFSKQFRERIREIDPQQYANDTRLRELYDFLGLKLEVGQLPLNAPEDRVILSPVQDAVSADEHCEMPKRPEGDQSTVSYLSHTTPEVIRGPRSKRQVNAQSSVNTRGVASRRSKLNDDSNKENAGMSSTRVVTPKRHRAAKRIRSPGYPSMSSPLHKKFTKHNSPKRPSSLVSDPFLHAMRSPSTDNGPGGELSMQNTIGIFGTSTVQYGT